LRQWPAVERALKERVSVMLALLCRDYLEGQFCCIRAPAEDETNIDDIEIEQPLHGSKVDWRSLRSVDWQIRRDAVARIGLCVEVDGQVTPEVLAALRTALKDEHWQVRRQSCYALQQLGETAVYGALPLLRQACLDKESSVRSAAALVLQVYGQDLPSRSHTEELYSREVTAEVVKRSFTGLSSYTYTGFSEKGKTGTQTTEEGIGFVTEDSEDIFPHRLERARSRSSGPSATKRSPSEDKKTPVIQRSAGDESTPIPMNLNSLFEEIDPRSSSSSDSQSGTPEAEIERQVLETTQETEERQDKEELLLSNRAELTPKGLLDSLVDALSRSLEAAAQPEEESQPPGHHGNTKNDVGGIFMLVEANSFIPSENTLSSDNPDTEGSSPAAHAHELNDPNDQPAPLRSDPDEQTIKNVVKI